MVEEPSTSSPGPRDGAEAAARVLGAVDLPVVLDEKTLERLIAVLGEHLLLHGDRKQSSNRVTQREAEAVEKALSRLCQLIENLQDRSNPPPRLTPDPRDGRGTSTPLDYWLTPYRFRELGGPPSVHDWPWITRLLAIYELAFGRPPKASPKGENQKKPHPTLRFLDAALQETSAAKSASAPEPFSPDTLRAFLKKKRWKVAKSVRELRHVLGLPEA